jgi:class 3 adenylate cyclase
MQAGKAPEVMKRSLITTLIIGVAVTLVVGVLHATKAIAGFEAVTAQLVTDYAGATRVFSDKLQYVLVLLTALGVVWITLSSIPRWRAWLLIGLLLMELFGLAWVCALYRVFFQPTPSALALIIGFAAAGGWSAFLHRSRSHLIRALFADRVSTEQFRRLNDGRISFDAEPGAYNVSVVACDIGGKLTFAEGGEPAAFTEATAKFIRETAARLVEAGAYLQAADGEGVIGLFGFPAPDPEHAQKAARVVLDIIKNSRERSEDKENVAASRDIRSGVSCGSIIAGALQESRRPLLLASGEPIDLARRFCALNQFYGSRALMDTESFDRVNESIVGRPIDFVSGLNSHDQVEVYEPLWFAAEAGPQRVAQRDSFWSGVVLYREKRWAEAYAEFQKARGSETEEDPPLEFYLRRLEPLILQLTEWPVE